jgi:hypothetical protein
MEKNFTTDYYVNVPIYEISNPVENTPAFEDTLSGEKIWCLKEFIHHRLTGPARIRSNETYEFWLDGKHYSTVKEWINVHPNPDLYFNAIGIFTETDKILWFLQN